MASPRSLLALVLGLLLPLMASAAEVRGRIVRIDPDRKELVMQGIGRARGIPLTFRLSPQTQILLGGQTATLADVPTGRRALIQYEEREGRLLAGTIRIPALRLANAAARTANTAAPAPAIPTPAAANGNVVTGQLRRVGLTDREVIVIGPGPQGPETETTIVVPEGTRILRDGKPADFDSLTEGEAVAVQVDRPRGKGRMTASSLQVGMAPPAQAPGAAAVPPMPPRNPDMIPRIRQVLHVADYVLQQVEQRQQK